jgi:hypothetical protein
MTNATVPTSTPDQPSAASLSILVIAALAGLLAVSYRSFEIKPVGDDFPYAHEVDRGQTQGVGALFTRSFTRQTYRPLASLSIWLVGRGPMESRPSRLRLLGYICMAGYAAVGAIWIRSMRLRWTGAVAALLALVFHPVNPAALCSIDGFNALASSGLLWLGAWSVWRLQDKPIAAAIAAFICFIIGAGFKVYTFALVPLSAWTALMLWRTRRWIAAALIALVAACGFAIVLVLRHATMPPGGGAEEYLKLNPISWGINFVLFIISLLFPGNSIWVYLRQDFVALGAVAGGCVIILLLIVVGLRRNSETSDQTRKQLFLIGGLLISMFPAIFTPRISEMYVPPLILPFALLVGLAADGWRGARPIPSMVAMILGIVALASSAQTIHAKTDAMVEMGNRADTRLRQILSMIPPDARNLKICLLFDPRQLPARRTFSVYLTGDDALLVQPITFEWLAPGRGLVLQTYWLGDPQFDPRQYDVILLWDAQTQKFQRIDAR